MAQETLTVVTAVRAGIDEGQQDVTTAGGFRFPNDGRTFLCVANDNIGAKVLTFAIQPTLDGNAVAVKTITVTQNEYWVMGPFPTKWYNDANGYCVVTIDVSLGTAPNGVSCVSVPAGV